jgi:hypothetical protein
LPKGLRFEKVLYFPSTAMYSARRVFAPAFWRARRSEFIFKPLAKSEILALIARARIVVDVERPVQAGLTMRTMEMLGAGRKLITTNPQVLQADFFEPSNIAVIDRLRPDLPAAFVTAPYVPQPAERLRRYSLSGWLDDVLAR